MEGFYKRVVKAQCELKAPKNQYNDFGKYKYRSCEDILEAAKPVMMANGLMLNVSDKIMMVGDRFYVEATATIYDTESGASISSTASAREELTKKGMDGSQVTGTASSYARKYALNGLLNIDDTKDADTNEYKKNQEKDDLVCDCCGKKIVASNGYSPTRIANNSKKQFGQQLCWNCASEQKQGG